jgi:hypothetical protein
MLVRVTQFCDRLTNSLGFFLSVCKTRFSFPDAALFQPTDAQDDSEETGVSSLRKILGVLAQLRRDYPGSNQTDLLLGTLDR